jgi:hypothetical protein
MPNAAKKPPRGPEPAGLPRRGDARALADAADARAAGTGWRRVFTTRRLIAAVVAGFLLEAAILYWCRTRTAPAAISLPKEIPLGVFEFTRSNGRDSRVYRGQFDLFVRLADDRTSAEQRKFVQHQPELQKAVEEALLRLRAADFTDPRLVRLKNRVQERLNEELGFDGITEVLISNLTIEAKAAPILPAAPRGSSSTESPSSSEGR